MNEIQIQPQSLANEPEATPHSLPFFHVPFDSQSHRALFLVFLFVLPSADLPPLAASTTILYPPPRSLIYEWRSFMTPN